MKKATTSQSVVLSGFEEEKLLRDLANVTSQKLSHVASATVGELEYALKIKDPKIQRHAMRVALQAAENALGLARNLRYFATQIPLHPEVVELSQVLLDTVEMVEKEFATNRVRINVFAEASTYVEADAHALRQVFLNLLYYAEESMKKGGKITLSLRKLSNTVEIKLKDSGDGRGEKDISAIQGIHFDTEGSANKSILGLALVKVLIDTMGGTISVTSTPKRSSTFTLSLPFDANLEPPFIQKRKHRRVKLNLPAQLSFGRRKEFEGELNVLSNGGCFLNLNDEVAAEYYEKQTPASLHIQYFEQESIEIRRCRIVNTVPHSPYRGVGIAFDEVNEKARKIIAALVQGHTDQ